MTVDRDELDDWMRERDLMLISNKHFADLTRQLAQARHSTTRLHTEADRLRAALTELIHASRGLAFFDQIKCERWNTAYAQAREVVGLEEEQ